MTGSMPQGVDVPALVTGSIENLLATYRDDGLFPYSCVLDDDSVVCDYDHEQTVRYTINSLLGLDEATSAGHPGISAQEIDGMWKTFLDRHGPRIQSPADLGLLSLALAARAEMSRPTLAATLGRLRTIVAGSISGLDMQSLSWIVWGCSATARAGLGGDDVARVAMARIQELVSPATGLPRHSASKYRRSIVSFGGLAYFLRACREFASTFDDERVRVLFESGVRRAIAFQGPQGEWPWMIDVRSGKPFDVYPVFSVHQDSMAMLFLHPYADSGEDVTEVVRRSIAWCFGENELSESFYVREPFFFAYRSIERFERLPRLRRYLRGVTRRPTSPAARFASANVRVNSECRSYHLGWVLFAWSSRLGIVATSRTRSGTLADQGV